MPLYPLGISRSRDVRGTDEQAVGQAVELRWRRAGDLACVFVDAPHDAFKPVQHAAALDAIHRRICVLPMRFGVEVRDEAEIGSLLQARRRKLLDDLDRLDGACEMALRIALPSPERLPTAPHSQAPSSLAYLQQRRSCYRQADAAVELERLIVEQFTERLRGTCRTWRRLPSAPPRLIRLAFLVERDLVPVFRSRLEGARSLCRRGHCVVLGPWPPYSFV